MNNKSSEHNSQIVINPNEELPEEASVTEYVSAAVSASSRSRSALIVLLASTVLLAVQLRNHTYSWLDARIEIRDAALRILENPDRTDSLVTYDSELYQRARRFLMARGMELHDERNKEILKNELEDYRKLSIEQGIYVHTPLLGISFERNDTGMFAGFALTVMLIWLGYSLAREYSNLKLLFNTSMFEGINFRRCYQLLAMQQVLTVPLLTNATKKRRWRWIPKMLYLTPLLVYSLQLYFDLTTVFYVGEVLGRGKMWLAVISSTLFFALIVIFTIWCIRVSIKIDRVWDKAASKVYSTS